MNSHLEFNHYVELIQFPELFWKTITHHTTYIVTNRPHFLHILLVRSEFYLRSFFLQSTALALCNWLASGCFPNHNNLNLFNSWVNHYLPYISKFKMCPLLFKPLPQVATKPFRGWNSSKQKRKKNSDYILQKGMLHSLGVLLLQSKWPGPKKVHPPSKKGTS